MAQYLDTAVPQLRHADPVEALEPFPPKDAELVVTEITAEGRRYNGWAECCRFSCQAPFYIPDSLILVAGRKFGDLLREKGSELLVYKVWKKPGFFEKFYWEVQATTSPVPWGVIIPAVFGLLKIAIIALVLITVFKFFYKAAEVVEEVVEKIPKELMPPILMGAGTLIFLAILALALRKRRE